MDLREKVAKIVSFDFDMNGDFVNAPYKIHHNGEIYKAEIYYSEKDGRSVAHVKIVRPVQVMADFEFQSEV